MNFPTIGRKLLLATAAAACMASSECEESYTCDGACRNLARCEDAWLVEAGKAPMSDEAFSFYVAQCVADCRDVSDYDEIECLETETCGRLRDGKCSI